MADIKVMPLKGLLAESFSYMRDNGREMTLFAVVHMMFLTAAFELIDGWHDVFFLPWLAAYYLFWCFFFRFYFKNFFIPYIPLPTHTPIVNMSEATFPVFYLL